MIFLGAFHPCYACKVNNRGCSHCPRQGKGNVTDQDWCWWLTVVHHLANVLDLASSEGPRYVVPSYDGVTFPPFPKELSKAYRTPLQVKDIMSNWDAILANPPVNYYGVPHAKVAQMNKAKIRPVRSLWPFISSNMDKVRQRLHNIFESAALRILERSWAIGFEDGWNKDVGPSSRPRGRPKSKVAKTIESVEAGLQGRTTATKDSTTKASGSGQQSKGKQPARREYSRVPDITEDEHGLFKHCTLIEYD